MSAARVSCRRAGRSRGEHTRVPPGSRLVHRAAFVECESVNAAQLGGEDLEESWVDITEEEILAARNSMERLFCGAAAAPTQDTLASPSSSDASSVVSDEGAESEQHAATELMPFSQGGTLSLRNGYISSDLLDMGTKMVRNQGVREACFKAMRDDPELRAAFNKVAAPYNVTVEAVPLALPGTETSEAPEPKPRPSRPATNPLAAIGKGLATAGGFVRDALHSFARRQWTRAQFLVSKVMGGEENERAPDTDGKGAAGGAVPGAFDKGTVIMDVAITVACVVLAVVLATRGL